MVTATSAKYLPMKDPFSWISFMTQHSFQMNLCVAEGLCTGMGHHVAVFVVARVQGGTALWGCHEQPCTLILLGNVIYQEAASSYWELWFFHPYLLPGPTSCSEADVKICSDSNNPPLHPGSDVAGFKAVYAGYLSCQGKKSRFNFSKMKHLVSEVKLFLKVLKILDYSRVKYSVKYQFQIQYHLHRVFLNSHEGCVCKSCFMNGMDRTFIKCLHEWQKA